MSFYMKSLKYIFMSLFLLIPATSFAGIDDCRGGDQKKPNPNDKKQTEAASQSISVPRSVDPNELIGPIGYDDSIRWVSVNDVLNYTILFENDPEFAGANAQTVDVRFDFPDKSLIRRFNLGTYGFANMAWNVDDNISAYQNRLDLKDTMNIYVDLVAGVDVSQNQAFWHFSSIDPESGLKPWQIDRGMLPINDSTHIGEGFVSFKLKPNENFKTGDTIAFSARILFDQNDTIPTNRWHNTIDAGMPTSKAKGRVDSKNETLYHITMQASDDEGGSGLKNVHLYLANNFGIYEEYAVCPVDTVIDFEVEKGKQYKFFSIAEDNVGNREPLKEEADFIININAAPTDIILSDTVFQDDIMPHGFIGELSSVDTEEGGKFTYELAEGDNAIHNDMFIVEGSQLLAKGDFKSAEDTVYHIRISTTDEGGLSFSKPFDLSMQFVLERPEPDTLVTSICEGDYFEFHGDKYVKAGTYTKRIRNEFMRDSIYLLQLSVLEQPAAPAVTVEDTHTLVSSADNGNQWFTIDAKPVVGATGKKFTPEVDGIYYVCVSNGSCYSKPSNAYHVKLSTDIDLTMNLKKGWNWISSNLSDTARQNALTFLGPIIDNVVRMEGQFNELYNEPESGWNGNLKSITATDGYKLNVYADVSNVWSGKAFVPSDKPISMNFGWNWIGYVPVNEYTVEEAFADVAPTERDVVKNMTDFAVYHGGRWVGTLARMKPGEGYLYCSAKVMTFTYPSTQVCTVSEYRTNLRTASVEPAPWVAEMHECPDNMNIIADVYSNGNVVPEGLYTIGAFQNDKCVGIGKYVEGKLFITVNGNASSSKNISFKAYDNSNGNVFEIVESIGFQNLLIGDLSSPLQLSISNTGVQEIAGSEFIIYPKPVRSRMYINGPTHTINHVTVISMNGARVLDENGYSSDGINVASLASGTYVVVIYTTKGRFVDKVIKAE